MYLADASNEPGMSWMPMRLPILLKMIHDACKESMSKSKVAGKMLAGGNKEGELLFFGCTSFSFGCILRYPN